jgi:hypothetical protein
MSSTSLPEVIAAENAKPTQIMATTAIDTTDSKPVVAAEVLSESVIKAIKEREKSIEQRKIKNTSDSTQSTLSPAAQAAAGDIDLGKTKRSEEDENTAATDEDCALSSINDSIAIVDARLKEVINAQHVKEKAIGRVLEPPSKNTTGAVFQTTCLNMGNWTRCDFHEAKKADRDTAYKIAEIGEDLFRSSVALLKEGVPAVLIQLSYVDKMDSSIMVVCNAQVRVIIEKKALEHAAKKVAQHQQTSYLHNKTVLYVVSSNFAVISLQDISVSSKNAERTKHQLICDRQLDSAINMRLRVMMRTFYTTAFLTIGRAFLNYKVKAQIAANAESRKKRELAPALLVVHIFSFEERPMLNKMEVHDVEQVEVYAATLAEHDVEDKHRSAMIIEMAKTVDPKKSTECVVWLQKNMAGPMSTEQIVEVTRVDAERLEKVMLAMAVNTSNFVDSVDKNAVVTSAPAPAPQKPAAAATKQETKAPVVAASEPEKK